MYVDVALPLPVKRPFTYGVAEDLRGSINLGTRVLVQLGRRFLIGVVVSLDVSPPRQKTKEVLAVEDAYPRFSKVLLDLTKWISEYYFSAWGECLKMASPQYPDIYEKIWVEALEPAEEESLPLPSKEIWETIKGKKEVALSRLAHKMGLQDLDRQLEHLRQMRLVRFKVKLPEVIAGDKQSSSLQANPKFDSSQHQTPNSNDDQERITRSISEDMERGLYSAFLLVGKNASQRREAYLKLARRVVQSGKQALILLPEASSVEQVVSSWQNLSGQEAAVLHSQIPISKRLDSWHKIKSGRFHLVVGTRLAVFAPLENSGLIVVEEEAHPSHKEESSPYYHARDVAVMRGKLERSAVVLSCGFPSLESYWNCQKGKYKLYQMKETQNRERIPKVEIIDRKKRGGTKTSISPLVLDILRKETRPAILLLNRRGFSRSVACGDCGLVFRCPNCGISLVFHKADSLLRCHYCDYRKAGVKACPGCGGTSFSYRGFGTQNLEGVLKTSLPQLKSIRLDRDVLSSSREAWNILDEFHQGKYQALLGTRMILQGLDLSKAGLFIIISMDEMLAYPDFRANERAFHFLARIAERIAEANPSAKLVVGTSRPEDPIIRWAVKGDYVKFFQKELEQRRELFYPPFSHLISISFSGQSQQKVISRSNLLLDSLHKFVRQEKISQTQISGPVLISYAKRKRQNEWRTIIKTAFPMRINRLLDSILGESQARTDKSVKLKVEVDPLSLI